VFGKLAALAALLSLLVVPLARAATTDTATAEAEPGPYFVGSPITFTSTTPCTTNCRLRWKYLSGTRLGEQMGEGVSVQRAFSTPGLKTVELQLTELCVGTSRLICDSIAYVSVDVEAVPLPIDLTPPTITAAGLEAEATGPDTVVSYSFGATDPDDLVVAQSCTPASGDAFPLGSTPIDCTAVDSNGNVGQASFTVVVSDTTGPTVSAPVGLAAEATSPDGAVVNFDVSATDLVDGAVPAVCSTPSGSTFPLGSTAVTCTASDARGNTGFARFEVVVKDATAPVLTLPDTITTEATSSAGADVTYTATATDLVDGARDTSCSPASGATFAVGSTTVTCTATDASGNAGSGTFLVNVVDTTAPTLTVPGPVVVANATSPLGATVSYNATATDSVAGDVAPTCSAASGSVFAIGGTTVTCTATDSLGNTSAAQTFTVEVKGAVEQLSDQLQVVTSWRIPGHLVEIRTKGPLWSLTQAKPKVNLACQLIRDFESQLGGTLGQTLTATQREWVLDQLTRIYAVIGCVTPA
jgi:HYR domain-containing protein